MTFDEFVKNEWESIKKHWEEFYILPKIHISWPHYNYSEDERKILQFQINFMKNWSKQLRKK